jgi:hypothetical protein
MANPAIADARGPPWCQQARLQAKEPHKLASGRMSRGANPDSALHSDSTAAAGARPRLAARRAAIAAAAASATATTHGQAHG